MSPCVFRSGKWGYVQPRYVEPKVVVVFSVRSPEVPPQREKVLGAMPMS